MTVSPSTTDSRSATFWPTTPRPRCLLFSSCDLKLYRDQCEVCWLPLSSSTVRSTYFLSPFILQIFKNKRLSSTIDEKKILTKSNRFNCIALPRGRAGPSDFPLQCGRAICTRNRITESTGQVNPTQLQIPIFYYVRRTVVWSD